MNRSLAYTFNSNYHLFSNNAINYGINQTVNVTIGLLKSRNNVSAAYCTALNDFKSCDAIGSSFCIIEVYPAISTNRMALSFLVSFEAAKPIFLDMGTRLLCLFQLDFRLLKRNHSIKKA